MTRPRNHFLSLRPIVSRLLVAASILPLVSAVPTFAVASKSCTGGAAISDFKLLVEPSKGGPALPLTSVNIIQSGEKLRYEPLPDHGKKKNKDKITLVLVPAPESSSAHVEVLKVEPADSPATWEVPFRVSVVGLVFGSGGLNVKKLNALVRRNPQLIPQLTDYASSASKVEALVQTLSKYEQSSPGATDLHTVLTGFSKQYGVSLPSVDSAAPSSQQATQLLQAILPAFNSTDPLAVHTSLGAQSTGLAASVASMFFGPTMTLATGGATFVNELRSSLFPGTDFRSAFAQPLPPAATMLCSDVQKSQPHTRNAYLWMIHVPDSQPPALALQGATRIPVNWPSTLVVSAATVAQLPLAARAREWQLVSVSSNKTEAAVPAKVDVGSLADRVTLDLAHVDLAPGPYDLSAKWDWTPLPVAGIVDLRAVPDLSSARLASGSHDQLVSANGNISLLLTGADFEFVKQVRLTSESSPLASAQKLPFALGPAAKDGAPGTLSVQLDTALLSAGSYFLQIDQVNGSRRAIPITIQPPNPTLTDIPLRANLDEMQQAVELHGTDLQRIQKLVSSSAVWKLAPIPDGSRDLTSRLASVTLESNAAQGDLVPVSMFIKGIHHPLTVPGVLSVAAPLPKILSLRNSFAPDASVAFRTGEIPADAASSFEMQVAHVGPQPFLHVSCKSASNTKEKLLLSPGEKASGADLEFVGEDALFLSFTPGDIGRPSCLLMATLSEQNIGASQPFPLGRVVRLPRIDKFTLSPDKIGHDLYQGTLTGQDLQLIEKTGWSAAQGQAVDSIPTPVPGNPQQQTLNIVMPWPPPQPQAPLYIWLRGEKSGRATTAKY